MSADQAQRRDWMVRDEFGRVWPPQFKPQLTDPESPLCILKLKPGFGTTSQASAAREGGKGWGNGTIAGLTSKPLTPAPKKIRIPNGQGNPKGRPRAFSFGTTQHGTKSVARMCWDRVRALPDGERLTCAQLGEIFELKASHIRCLLQPAVAAGVFAVTKRGTTYVYELGPVMPAGVVA